MKKVTTEPIAISKYLKSIERDYLSGKATEHSYRPALQELIQSFRKGIKATNEPKREKCGAPDFIVEHGQIPLGYIEAKDVGKPLDAIQSDSRLARPKTRDGEQLKRYLAGLGNLILTDYLEFRWYENGKQRLTARIAATTKDRKLRRDKDGVEQFSQLMNAFLDTQIPTVGDPKELAERMASLAKILKSTIVETFGDEDKGGSLHSQLEGFRKVLLHDLKPDQFADMYAQTICYGLFSAKCNQPESKKFRRKDAVYALPETNPFLAEMFDYIAGRRLDERLIWAVDHLVELLNRADLHAILEDFGKRTRREDPVVHFYETFLAAYDPKMRKARGVYYTPEPVVSYIVRSIDHILKTDFGIKDGLADTSKIPLYKTEQDKDGKPRKVKVGECHRVLILDPAVGTGTFLHGVIDHIHEHLTSKGQKGMWSSYVSEHLLPRLFGFELLMAPYAVAHMKLGLQLKDYGYEFKSGERLRIYLTNTLEEARDTEGLLPFEHIIAEEANKASEIKSEKPVMVILGNPPYSGHSANKGEWISKLLRGKDIVTGEATANYFEVDGKPLGERNPKWLNDDYVKFIRFAQWRIERTGYGILSFISNHSYLDSPTFKGMRQSLTETFDSIYVLDLHGNTKKREVCPDGSKDENVFDIQQGVAIGAFVKKGDSGAVDKSVKHAHLWGLREKREEKDRVRSTLVGGKYHWLYQNSVETTEWLSIEPKKPHRFFIPRDIGRQNEYEENWCVTDIMSVHSVGIVTARDKLTVHWTPELVWQTVSDFAGLPTDIARDKYDLGEDVQDWKANTAQEDLRRTGPAKNNITRILYRPYDIRFTYYTGQSRGFICRPRRGVMRHLLGKPNLGLVTSRMTKGESFRHVQATRNIAEVICMSPKTSNNGFVFPLYLYPDPDKNDLFDNNEPTTAPGGRSPNLASAFIDDLSRRLRMTFVPEGKGNLGMNDRSTGILPVKNHGQDGHATETFGPEDVFDYIYAVLHSPTYRSRYAEFLKIDFPRIPLTSKKRLFRKLCALGEELVGLHLMEKHGPSLTAYPVDGDHLVEKIRYVEPGKKNPKGRIWINKEQYFEGVPPVVWEFHIGGYQVCNKWLKDRKGRNLTHDDLEHYQLIVSALSETIRLMSEIDEAIDKNGGWPIE